MRIIWNPLTLQYALKIDINGSYFVENRVCHAFLFRKAKIDHMSKN